MKKEIIHLGLMTERTHRRIEAKLQELKRKIENNQLESGATFESAQDWHDNGAYDVLQQDLQVLVTQYDALKAYLLDVQILQSRRETSQVDVGNTVVVQYLGEPSPEKFTILGTADAETETHWISATSPLGSALIGKEIGQIISISPNITVTLLQILAGEF
ncbi:MAG: GreA/GreB family elongation factor [Patescibacteria group bacterium]